MAGGAGSLEGPFDEAKYSRYSAGLWRYLKDLKPYLWRRGETYPSGVSELHQLFASGEIDITMSNNDGEVDNKILQGVLPESSRGYVFEEGAIQNSHYLGVVANARNRAGALVVANFLISPEAQYEKMKPAVWGDGTILDLDRLPAEWQRKFRDVPGRRFAPDRRDLRRTALQELAPEYMIRISDDFRKHVLP
jgi:putative spermidine/putrescine transport system substrate-binding protein